MPITSTVTKEKFDEIQAANPGVELAVAQHDKLPIEVVIRSPTKDQYTIYRNLVDEGKRQDGMDALVAFGVIWPPAPERQVIMDAYPAIVGVWAGEIVEHAGYTAGMRRKKF